MTQALQIFVEHRGQPAQLAGTAVTMDAAQAALDALSKTWAKSKKGRTAGRQGITRIMRYSDGKMAALAFIDPLPVPAGPEKGQPPVKKGGAQ